jgi:hypothetical protein
VSLCVLVAIQFPDDISKAAAFVSSSPRARMESKLHGNVIDAATSSLDDGAHTLTTSAEDEVRNKLPLENLSHDQVVIEQASPTLELHHMEQHSEKISNHGAQQSSIGSNDTQKSADHAQIIIEPPVKSTKSQADEVDAQSTSEQPTLQSKSQQRRAFSGLSRTHQSLLSKTSHMRRQRFVTGKYPLYVEVKQNPTKKWLGLAESRIYLNG